MRNVGGNTHNSMIDLCHAGAALAPAHFMSADILCYSFYMPKPRGREHTSLTETAALVVRELEKLPDIKMIAPGEIRTGARRRGGARFITTTYTVAGMELLISGESVQKVSVHTDSEPRIIFALLKDAKKLRNFSFNERERKPGI